MRLRAGLAVPVSLAALLAFAGSAFSQDGPAPAPGGSGGSAPAGRKEESPPPAAAPKEAVDTQVEVKGSRYRIRMNHGAQIEGVLPQGMYWEKRDTMSGEYEEAQESDKDAGLRLYYVLGMEGDLFVMKRDIKEVKDLGELTDAQKRAIRDQVIEDRKQKVADREKVLKEEMAKMKVRERDEARKAESAAKDKDKEKGGDKEKKSEGSSAEDDKKGDALLAKFPSPDWSEDRRKEILKRRYTIGQFPNDEEKEFINDANFALWKAALERKEEAEGGKKEEKKSEKKDESKEEKKSGYMDSGSGE